MAEKLNLEKKNFSEWWDKVVSYAKLLDDRYPIKGVYIWMPYGHKAVKLMMGKVDAVLEGKGNKECYFPLFATKTIFGKEKDFLEGFMGEALRVTAIGRRKLDEELIVRPTSEAIIYNTFSTWIRSWRDLPMKVYQTVPIFRWETKMTKPMIRCREITKFNETHTALATKAQADENFQEGIVMYKEIFDFLQLGYLVLKTPEWDTFAGALYNYDFFAVMPDGKGVELASVINLGQKFAKTYDISYLDKNEKKQHVWQNTFGISERALGVALAVHGDDKGLIFPSGIAPIQVVVVPILKGNENDKKVLKACDGLNLSFRNFVDVSDSKPGQKFNHWEVKGVPIRVDIGERDLENDSAVVVRRDTREKKIVKLKDVDTEIGKILKLIDFDLKKKADAFLDSMINTAKDVDDAQMVLKKHGGIVKVPWCADTVCGKQMEEKLVGSALGVKDDEKADGKCVCGKQAKKMLYFARTY
jgi:prolyl-tRNA synthetase